MENKTNRAQKGLMILVICLAVGAIGYIGYLAYQDIQGQKEMKQKWTMDSQVDVQRMNDSTYHVNLGNGSSCFTIQKLQDSLSLAGVNLMMVGLCKDTLTIVNRGHQFTFAYYDFFEDSIPDRSKISFNLN